MTRRSNVHADQKPKAKAGSASGLKEFSVSISEAKSNFEGLLRRVRPGRAACITRYGQPYVYMLSAADFRRLVRNYRRRIARRQIRLEEAQLKPSAE